MIQLIDLLLHLGLVRLIEETVHAFGLLLLRFLLSLFVSLGYELNAAAPAGPIEEILFNELPVLHSPVGVLHFRRDVNNRPCPSTLFLQVQNCP